jgi:hypothetical protein
MHRSIRRLAALALAAPLGLGAVACGGDENPASSTPPPDVAGTYYANWTLQVLRTSDGFQTSFYCSGQLTLVQGTTQAGGTASLSGFAVVAYPCAPESYDLVGSVAEGGAIAFVTDGPPPPEGPCPGGEDVRFSGQVTEQDGWRSLSVRGVTTVTCPEFGEHDFTYLIQGSG